MPFTENPGEWAWNLILPWCTLAFLYSALYARLTRAGMLETMGEDYIRTARAKGLKERRSSSSTACAPRSPRSSPSSAWTSRCCSAAPSSPRRVFSFQGMGAYAIQGVTRSDLPIVMGVTLVAAFFIVVCNLLVDLVYAAIDPRVRLS